METVFSFGLNVAVADDASTSSLGSLSLAVESRRTKFLLLGTLFVAGFLAETRRRSRFRRKLVVNVCKRETSSSQLLATKRETPCGGDKAEALPQAANSTQQPQPSPAPTSILTVRRAPPRPVSILRRSQHVCGNGLARPAERQPGILVNGIKQSSSGDLARDVAPVRSATKKLEFKPSVSCCLIADMTDLDLDFKTQLWWQREDFDEFLRVRVQIGKAYRELAQRRGTEVREMPPEPSLAHESRRGLGLDRKIQRSANHSAYIKAVLNEQDRQRQQLRADAVEAGSEPDINSPVPLRLDFEALARVARLVSDKDRRYALEQARRDLEMDVPTVSTQASPTAAKGARTPSFSTTDGSSPKSSSASLSTSGEETAPRSPDGTLMCSMKRVESFVLPDSEGEGELQRQVSPMQSLSKGFGHSRDELEQAGLSATGHTVRRRSTLYGPASDVSDLESDVESDCGAESDADGHRVLKSP